MAHDICFVKPLNLLISRVMFRKPESQCFLLLILWAETKWNIWHDGKMVDNSNLLL